MSNSQTQAKAIILLCNALLETVQEMGENGAPAGPMYAAFMHTGMGLDAFNNLMNLLVVAGKVRKVGHVYFAVSTDTAKLAK